MPHATTYFDFLTLCEENNARILQYSSHISPKLLALFVVIALKHDQNQSLTVSDAMALQDLASSAALHKRIDDLREAGMIDLVFKGENRRTKYLIPTEKGNRYLKLMGQLLRTALRHKATV
jgi:DNA-binding MarR family transcriptional regulator